MTEKYDFTGEKLGYGSFSIVCVCVDKKSRIRKALKIIARQPLSTPHNPKEGEILPATMARDEISILRSLNHPNVIRLTDFYESEEALFIVTELCGGGELFESLVKRTSFFELDAKYIMRNIMEGVAYLHKHRITHRDLKPENILLKNENDITKGIMISDFGLAKIMPEDGLLLTACGSPQYVAPEVLLGMGYDTMVDIWSCGVIAFALLCGYTPFFSTDVQTLLRRVVTLEYHFDSRFWTTQSELAKDFIRRCLCDKSERITAAQALEHPWLADIVLASDKANLGAGLSLKRLADCLLEEPDRGTEIALALQLERLEELQRIRRKMNVLTSFEFEHVDQLISRMRASCPKNPALKNVFWAAAAAATKAAKEPQTDTKPSHADGSPKASNPRPNHAVNASDSTRSYTRHYIRGTPSGMHVQKQTTTVDVLNKLLEQYGTDKLPAYARVDPTVQMRPQATVSIKRTLQAMPALLRDGISVGGAIVSHALYGPPKRSWGVEMSILTRTIREFAKHSDLTNIPSLQKMFELLRFLPIPDDGLITPVTFRVKRRNLRGFLEEADACESGKRELTGEWIVGKHTWRRLQSEWQAGKRGGKERVLLYVHGGAYFVMSATTYRPLTIALSKYCECRVFAINYRLAPDTIFPGALHDVVHSYLRLTEDLHIPHNNVVLAADSAGGALAIATLMYLRDNKYPLPGGAILFSPWVDLTMSCESWDTNQEFDYLPRPPPGDHCNPVYAYLGPNMDKYLMHPYASPLFGNMLGLPPLLIQTGDAEVLRDENILFAHKCSLAGVAVRHEIYEDCVHVFQFFLFLEASRKALQSVRHFIRTALDKRPTRRASLVEGSIREQLDSEVSGSHPGPEPNSPSVSQCLAEELEEPVENGLNTLLNFEPSGDEETWDLDEEENKVADLPQDDPSVPATGHEYAFEGVFGDPTVEPDH